MGTNMRGMFRSTDEFNQPVDSWYVSSVINMRGMFLGAVFNQPVDSWDVSSVTSMANMFFLADEFNQPVDSWDVSSVTNIQRMFNQALAFNQPVDSWDVSSVINMFKMFEGATDFNQCLSTWADKVPPAVNTRGMFEGSSCSNIGSLGSGSFSRYHYDSNPTPFYIPDPNGPWCQDADVCIKY